MRFWITNPTTVTLAAHARRGLINATSLHKEATDRQNSYIQTSYTTRGAFRAFKSSKHHAIHFKVKASKLTNYQVKSLFISWLRSRTTLLTVRSQGESLGTRLAIILYRVERIIIYKLVLNDRACPSVAECT